MLIVFDHASTIEVYAVRPETARDAYVHIAATPDDVLLRGAKLVARITDGGDCVDPLGRRIDALPFVRAFQAATLARRAAATAVGPEHVHFSASADEAGSRIGLTVGLLQAIAPIAARNRIISLLFQVARPEDFTYAVVFAIQDGLDEQNLTFDMIEAPSPLPGATDFILTARR